MILVLNCGSQSIKWKLFDKNLKLEKKGERDVFRQGNYQIILKEELSKLKKQNKDIKIVGHRVVHGGEKFRTPVKINDEAIKKISEFNKWAPLHNPFNLLGIKISRGIFSKANHIAVFDTEFYAGFLPKVYTYPLPENLREKYGFRKFGFHGISHEYSAREAAKIVGKNFKNIKIITCHLGGGASITAIKGGRAVDTSMGFSPLEGLVMMTRSGSIDPAIVIELAKVLPFEKINKILNHESGLKGICGEKEMLQVLKKVRRGDKKARLALDIFVYQIKKYIGAYFAALEGCDLLVFTGKIGFGSSKIRNMVCKGLPFLKNTRVIAIKPDEELAMAKKIKNFL